MRSGPEAVTSPEAQRITAIVAAGLELARQAGRSEPSLRDAVWELLLEAADTLRRLPDRERGWLTAKSRAHWPDYIRTAAAAVAEDTGGGTIDRSRSAPANAAAIDRLDMVLLWLPHAAGANPRRDIGILFGLACGLRVALLRRRFGCGRRTVYDVRDRAIARICGWLRSQSESCHKLA